MEPDERGIQTPRADTALAPRFRTEDILLPVRPRLLLGYLDLAVAGTLEYSRHAGVYLGPWWELPNVGAEGQVMGWRRAVLLRRVERGGLHLGHLYLVVLEGGRRVDLRTEDLHRWGATPNPAPNPVSEIVMRRGDPQLLLIIRPTYAETSPRLLAFAEDLAERFRLQID